MLTKTFRLSSERSFKEILSLRSSYSTAPSKHHMIPAFALQINKRPQVYRLRARSVIIPGSYGTKTQSLFEIKNQRSEDAAGAANLKPSAENNNPKESQKNVAHDSDTLNNIVSTSSSTRYTFKKNRGSKETDHDTMKDIKLELKAIKETFSLEKIPRDSLYLGVAGVIPYAVTSMSTVYLAWNINHAATESYFSLSPEIAHRILDLITPIQIGYGAVIISFLGAVHWGLEYAEFGGRHSYRRLIYGVITPIIAWPTLLMPVETALISQFLAFNYMYFVDTRATVKGWFPPWYSIYRFILTFFVGASILTSLVGRGQIVSSEMHHPLGSVTLSNSDGEASSRVSGSNAKRCKIVAMKETDTRDNEKYQSKDQ